MIHPAITAADKLGCYVGLFVDMEKGKLLGVNAALLSQDNGELTVKFEGKGATESAALDDLLAKLKEAVNER